MFGDPVTNPKKWSLGKLVDLVSEFRYGSSNKSQPHGKPILRIPNVVDGTLNLSDLKLVPKDGDILFVRTNGNPDFVGRCAVFERHLLANKAFSGSEYIFASYLIRARLIPGSVEPIFLREFLSLAQQLAAKDQALVDRAQQLSAVEAELEQLRQEIAVAKAAAKATPDPHDYSEAETRDYFIDLLLKEAGWNFATGSQPGCIQREFPVQGMPSTSGNGFADYVLWGDDGKPLALIEAKRTRRDPQVGQHQAKLYADCLEQQFGQRPLIFYTNGYTH
jgi:hypothetical protein